MRRAPDDIPQSITTNDLTIHPFTKLDAHTIIWELFSRKVTFDEHLSGSFVLIGYVLRAYIRNVRTARCSGW